jgi:2-(1,2-epoxy-1,2-dihydrophenyl)acetyl-CoA isomerase
MRNQMWSAEEALRRGLVTEVVPDAELGGAALALARELAQGPTIAYGEIKKLLLTTLNTPIETQLEYEAQAMARCGRTDDAWHAMNEVAARRKPTFVGH